MYQDWAKALCQLSGVDLPTASAFEIACNTGYLLFWLKQQGVGNCVGIDKADLSRQRTILQDVTGIHDIDFREGRWSSDTHSLSGLGEDEAFDLVICTAFAQHISDPLHLIKELSKRTKKGLLFHNLVGNFTWGMRMRYVTKSHPVQWGDEFPNNFDTRVSRKLLNWSLRECGFKEIIQLKYSRKWLPWSWYRCFSTLVCLK
jgi:2-polyprenyl-3-methyl-5-hydroxy-6-metoxy-1,4-benzoquinol methylase